MKRFVPNESHRWKKISLSCKITWSRLEFFGIMYVDVPTVGEQVPSKLGCRDCCKTINFIKLRRGLVIALTKIKLDIDRL